MHNIIRPFVVLLSIFTGLAILLSGCAKQFPGVENDGKLVIDSITPAIGGGGASVLIYGKGFSGVAPGNRVYFNGVAATNDTVASFNVLKVYAPVNGSTGAVSVAAHGDSVTGPVFTYLPLPAISEVIYKSTSFFVYGANFDPQQSVVSIGGQVTPGFSYSVSNGRQLLTNANYIPPAGLDNPVPVIVTVKGVPSNIYSFVFDPTITGFGYSRTGNITWVYGSLFGTRKVPSTLRVFYYDGNRQKVYLSPDPTIVNWVTGQIDANVPNYFPGPLPYTPPPTYMEVSVQGHIANKQYTN